MTAIVWVNMALTIPFLAAFIGVPLWITFRTPPAGPGRAHARAHRHANTARAAASARPAAADDHPSDTGRRVGAAA
jgi:hypothetical protein